MNDNKKCYVLKFGDMNIRFEEWSTHKKPVMAVSLDGGTTVYKVASFNNYEAMAWFVSCLEERFGRR